MDYLFFDIECANCFDGGKICEFGYVITDEHFKMKERNLFLVNPKDKFDPYVIKHMLAYKAETYRSAEDYPSVYPNIQKLFDKETIMVLGHTVDADAGYLNDEARRYNLPFFNYTFYDAKEMFTAYANTQSGVGLEAIGKILGASGPKHAHRSVDDAEATMEVVKEMCHSLGLTLEELISLCPDCIGKTENGIVSTPARERARFRREQEFSEMIAENRIEKSSARKFVKFRNQLKINEHSDSPLAGKKICFSRNYEDTHLKEMIVLIQKLADFGVKCIGKASECDIFVKCDLFDEAGTEIRCARFTAVCSELNAGRKIEIITLDELLEQLAMTSEELKNAPIPCAADFEEKEIDENGGHGSTIGAILCAAGINLRKFYIA